VPPVFEAHGFSGHADLVLGNVPATATAAEAIAVTADTDLALGTGDFLLALAFSVPAPTPDVPATLLDIAGQASDRVAGVYVTAQGAAAELVLSLADGLENARHQELDVDSGMSVGDSTPRLLLVASHRRPAASFGPGADLCTDPDAGAADAKQGWATRSLM
jgi:hypothetical protein